MTAAQLKASILDQAIRGHLTAKWREERRGKGGETAVELLARITAARIAASPKKGKAKTPASPQSVGEDEKPFELPDGWIWCRLGDLGQMERGSGIKRDETIPCGAPCLRYGEIYTSFNYLLSKPKSYVSDALFQACRHIVCGDVVFTLTGENKNEIAKALAYLGAEEIAAGGDLAIWHDHGCDPKFLAYMMYSSYMIAQKAERSTGDIIVHTSVSKIGGISFPLPPLAEQREIVHRVEELMPLAEKYGAAYERRRKLVADLPAQLRKSILQHAIEGKLVPQDPNDEPASELLKRISVEKSRLVKEKKIKKEATYGAVTEEECASALPLGWVWCRFGQIVINRDSERIPLSSTQRASKEKVFDYYGASGVIDKVDEYLFDKPLLLIGEDGANLITRRSPIAFIATGKFWVNNHAHVLDAINEDVLRYMELFVNAISLAPYVTGTAQPKMNQEKMNSIPVPLPPLAEQKRIVAKVEELLAAVERLSAER